MNNWSMRKHSSIESESLRSWEAKQKHKKPELKKIGNGAYMYKDNLILKIGNGWRVVVKDKSDWQPEYTKFKNTYDAYCYLERDQWMPKYLKCEVEKCGGSGRHQSMYMMNKKKICWYCVQDLKRIAKLAGMKLTRLREIRSWERA